MYWTGYRWKDLSSVGKRSNEYHDTCQTKERQEEVMVRVSVTGKRFREGRNEWTEERSVQNRDFNERVSLENTEGSDSYVER